MKDNPGLLVCVDFYKAFDTLEWSFKRRPLNTSTFQNT